MSLTDRVMTSDIALIQKIENDLDWYPKEDFDSGIRKTIHWYLENLDRLK